MMRIGSCLAITLLPGVVTACEIVSSSGDLAIKVDEAAIMSTLGGHRNSPAFVRLNAEPYPTALGTGADIHVYVSANGYASYGSITPEKSGSGIIVPEGTLIVREVLEPSGAIKTLTLMYKGPKGYNPDLGDFWFGVTDSAARPVLDAAGGPKTGRLAECYSCHIPRASDGYLFGVPADVRPVRPTMTPEPPPVPPLPPAPPPTAEPVCGDFTCTGYENCSVCSYDCGRCPDDDDDDDDGGGGGSGGDDDDDDNSGKG
jgi:hypothetical protein